MNQVEKAHRFESLHIKGRPLVLYNIWDAGSAKAVAAAGAAAIATGSWSVAAVHGFEDRENIPLDFALQVASYITASVDLPVTVDFEGGYAAAPDEVAKNVTQLIAAGAIGLNFEDQVVGGEGLYPASEQAARIAAIRAAADEAGMPLFINARTDLFLKAKDPGEHKGLLANAAGRVKAYQDAGASGFFAPGLTDESLIAELCEAAPLPVNIMMMEGAPALAVLAKLGVARVSFGPIPFVSLMAALREHASAALGGR